MFKRFCKHFPDLDLTSTYSQVSSSDPFLLNLRNQVISLLSKILSKEELSGLLPCGDYRELAELTLFYLGGLDQANLKIHRPRAIHKARWMARIIHAQKIIILRETILDTMNLRERWISDYIFDKLERFILFVSHVYIPWWFECPLAASSPKNGLTLLKNILKFADIDKVISEAVLKGFMNHLWYLVKEMVPVCLWDDSLDNDEKSRIAAGILSTEKVSRFENRHRTGFGKPEFPNIDLQSVELRDLVGSDSWKFFELLKVDPDFLNYPPESWEDQDSYRHGSEVIKALKVCNDSVERGVKLSADFLGAAKVEKNFQKILQVVENDRKAHPNKKNKKRTSVDTWYLHL